MKTKIFLIILSLFAFSSVFAYTDYIFNADEVALFNPYLYSYTNQSLGTINGWSKYGDCGSATLTPYFLKLNTFCSPTYGTPNNGFYQNLSASINGNFTIVLNWSIQRLGVANTYYIIDAEFLNSSLNVINSTRVFRTAYSGDSYNNVATVNIILPNNANILRFKAYIDSGTSTTNNPQININSVRLYNTSTIGVNYNITMLNPSKDNNYYYSSNVPLELKTNKFSSLIKVYVVDSANHNSSTGEITYLSNLTYSHYIGGFFYYVGSINSELTNNAFYIVNSQGNSLITKNISTTYLSPLTNLSLIISRFHPDGYESTTNVLDFYFLKPTKTGLITSPDFVYIMEVYYNNSFEDYLTFTNFNIAGITFDEDKILVSEVYLNGTYFYKVRYYYDSDEPIQFYTIKAKFKEINSNDSTNYYMSSFSNVSEANYVKTFIIYEYDGSLGKKLSRDDYIGSEQIKIYPYTDGVLNPEWYYGRWNKIDNPSGVYTYYSIEDYSTPFVLNLSSGHNIIIFKDDSGTLDYYSIERFYNSSLLNISLTDKYDNIVCFANDSYNDCDYNSFSKPFNSLTYHDNYNYTLIEVKIFCNDSGVFDLYYDDSLTAEDSRFLDYSAYIGSPILKIPFNPTYNEKSFSELTEYLRLNPEIIDYNDYDFSKNVMDWMSQQRQSLKAVFLPENVACYMTQNFNNNTLNVSFKATNSLFKQLGRTGLFAELKSQCDLLNTKRDLFGNEYEERDYLNYYLCVFNDFVDNNSEPVYYVGFFVLCLTVLAIVSVITKGN